MLQVFVDLQVVGLGSLHQAVDNCTCFGAVDGVNDMPVGSANGERPDGSPVAELSIGMLPSSRNTLRYFSWLIL